MDSSHIFSCSPWVRKPLTATISSLHPMSASNPCNASAACFSSKISGWLDTLGRNGAFISGLGKIDCKLSLSLILPNENSGVTRIRLPLYVCSFVNVIFSILIPPVQADALSPQQRTSRPLLAYWDIGYGR